MTTPMSTNCLERRAAEHARDARTRGLNFETVHRTDSYAAQRGLEQQLHERYKPSLDKLNGVSRRNPRAPEYRQAAEEFLQGQDK